MYSFVIFFVLLNKNVHKSNQFFVQFQIPMIPFLVLVFSILSYLSAFNGQMAWRSSGASHIELIENLYKNGLIKDQRIKQAMLEVDRADFTQQKNDAYEDRPQSSKFATQEMMLILMFAVISQLVMRQVSELLLRITLCMNFDFPQSCVGNH